MKHINHHLKIHNALSKESEDVLDEMFALFVQRKNYKEARTYLEEVKVTFSKYSEWDKVLRVAEAEKSFQELGYKVNVMRLIGEDDDETNT